MGATIESKLSLAQRLEASHVLLLEIIDSMKSSLRDWTQLKPKLKDLTEYLLKHLQLQNEDLFKALKENYKRLKPDSQIPDFLEADYKELKVRVYSFMEELLDSEWTTKKYSARQDVKDFIQKILERIEVERAYLIPYC